MAGRESVAVLGGAVPHGVERLFGSSELLGKSLLLSAATDVDEAGHVARQWLIVTESELAVVAPATRPERNINLRCIKTYQLDQLEECRIQGQVGSGYLQIRTNGVWIDLLRFSNSLSSVFEDVVERVTQLRRNRQLEVVTASDAERHCPSCGRGLGEDEASCPKCQLTSQQLFGRVGRMLVPYQRAILSVLALSATTVAIELVPPWLQKMLVDQVLAGGTKTWQADAPTLLGALGTIVFVLAVVRVLTAVLSVTKAKMSSEIGTRLTADLRTQMVQKLQRLCVSYHDRNQVGMLMSRVSYDTEAMHTFMHQLSGGFVLQLLQMVGIGAMLFVINAKLALLVLLPAPLVLVISWYYCKHFYVWQSRYWDAVGRQASALASLLTGIRVVKSFTQEVREDARFSDATHRLRESRVNVDLVTASFTSLIALLFSLGGLIVWYVGGSDVLKQEMTLGSLMAFLAYVSMFYAPLTTVSEGATWISSFVAASHRIFDLLDTPVTPKEAPQPAAVDRLKGHIRFDNVSFSYNGTKSVLSGLNLEIQPGESVGIVGRSGSGKSTLASLISRLYDVRGGAVLIDGIDVRAMSGNQLRRQIGVVLQEPYLFEGTIAANIAYGDPQAQPEKILSSAKAAAAHDFILKTTFGYETMLGERGAGLSGGERQRVSIARAILYEPQILILDEATSSIDTESERLIQSAIERFSRGRTTIAIAHRLSTLEHADRILVLDAGQLVEQGSHSALLAANGLYARFIQLQYGSVVNQPSTGLDATPSASSANGSKSEEGTTQDWEIRWLDPSALLLENAGTGPLQATARGVHWQGVYVLRAFPATHSEEFLSVRGTDPSGQDREIGMIRSLHEWPAHIQELVRRSLNRRYLLRVIETVRSFREEPNAIHCSGLTADGAVELSVANNRQAVKRFGKNGLLLIDRDDNHYLIPDLANHPALQRRLLQLQFLEL